MWCWSKDQFFRSAWRRLSINSARGGGGTGHHCYAHIKGPTPLRRRAGPLLPPPPPGGEGDALTGELGVFDAGPVESIDCLEAFLQRVHVGAPVGGKSWGGGETRPAEK